MDAAQQRFTSLYDTRHQAILAYFMRRMDSTAAAQDLTEDVFLVAWRKLAQIPHGEEAAYWLYGVARQTLAAYRRKAATRQRLMPRVRASQDAEPPGPEDQLVRGEEARSVLAAISTLRESDQELIKLAYWDELPHQAIAEMLGCSRSAVDVRLHRALRRLKKALAPSGHLRVEETSMPSPKEPPC